MTEINALLERSERYLKSAALLLNDGDFESAVSRTYYAMFYAVQAVLLTRGLSTSSHRDVLSTFGKEFVKTGAFSQEMGRELNRAFQKRQLGDYTHTFSISQEEAKSLLDKGERFVQEVENYLRINKFL